MNKSRIVTQKKNRNKKREYILLTNNKETIRQIIGIFKIYNKDETFDPMEAFINQKKSLINIPLLLLNV